MSGHWELLPHFLVRSTGFPFELLEGLALDETAAAADAALDGERRLEAMVQVVQEALRADRDGVTVGLRRRCWKRVRQRRAAALTAAELASLSPALGGLLARWDAAVAEAAELDRAARAALAAELPRCRKALRDLAGDPRFEEAVWLSSPQMAERGLRRYLEERPSEAPAAQMRRVERQLVAYVQRFCAKNDTAGFFGPIDYGDFAAPAAPPAGRPGAAGVRRREAFFAHWAVTALAQALAADPEVRPWLRPRRTALYRLDPAAGTAVAPDGRPLRLGPLAVRLLELVDGERTVAGIAERLGLEVAAVLGELDRLAAARVVAPGPDAPIGEVHALGWLRGWVAGLPSGLAARGRWLRVLERMVRIEAEFATAPLARKRALLADLEAEFEWRTDQPPRRGGGRFYADRLLVYEESWGGLGPLRLGPRAAEALRAQLEPVLDLYAAHACVAQRELRARGARRLAELAPAGEEVPLLRLVRALRDDPGEATAQSPWQRAVLAQLAGREDEREVAIDRAALPPVDRAELAGEVLLSSPDVLLLAAGEAALRAGDFDVVVGECHDTLLVWGWPLQFHPRPGAVERDTAAALGRAGGGRAVASVLPSRRVKIVPFEYPGPTIELLTPSAKPPAERIPASEVRALVEGGRPLLRAPGWPSLALYNGELHTMAHRVFGLPRVVPPPLDCGAHTPRLRLGRAVIQRQRWRVRGEELFPGRYAGDSYELLRDWRAASRRLGLPRHVFARVQGERKPVLVDGHNLFLVQLLHHLAPAGREVVLTEMLPGPGQLWLRGPDGSFCSELRLGACHLPEARP